jgi:hypothetical protein
MYTDDNKITKCGGHCYDGTGWKKCYFWGIEESKEMELTRSDDLHLYFNPEPAADKCKYYCKLFNNIKKHASESLEACNKIYGKDYEGRP